MTCAVVVTFDGLSAPNVVVAVVEALRELRPVPSSMVATLLNAPAAFGNARRSSEPLTPLGSVPMVQVTLPLLPMAGAVVTGVPPVGTPPKRRPLGRMSVTVTLVPVAWPMFAYVIEYDSTGMMLVPAGALTALLRLTSVPLMPVTCTICHVVPLKM